MSFFILCTLEVDNIFHGEKNRSEIYGNMNYDFLYLKYFRFLSFVSLSIVYLF